MTGDALCLRHSAIYFCASVKCLTAFSDFRFLMRSVGLALGRKEMSLRTKVRITDAASPLASKETEPIATLSVSREVA
jgi:hypothetical protein